MNARIRSANSGRKKSPIEAYRAPTHKFHSRIRAREILLVAVGHMPVIAKEIDSGKTIF